MSLEKLRGKCHTGDALEDALYKSMRLAIERLEQCFDPLLRYEGAAEIRKAELDKLALRTTSDIERWVWTAGV